MARSSRLVVPGVPHYIIQQGNDRQQIFRDESDFAQFLAWLGDGARLFRVAVHAYALLPDQLHLLATPADSEGLARMMQWIGRHYVPWFNRKYGRAGTLWQGRFRTSVIEPEAAFMRCCRHIDMAPVRSGLVSVPDSYRWSSYAHYAGIRPDPSIAGHVLYWALGNTPFAREAEYKRFVAAHASSRDELALDRAVRKGQVVGSETFVLHLEKLTGKSVRPAARGRPPRGALTKSLA